MRVHLRRFGWTVLPVALVASAAATAAGQSPVDDVDRLLQRIGAYVEGYYARAQHLVSEERVHVQAMTRDFSPSGRARRLLYELRVEWEPPQPGALPDPMVMRDLIEADGRPPRANDELECTDPRLVSPEPLAMLLPARQRDFRFTWVGRDREAGRQAVVVAYRATTDEPPTVIWKDNCVSVDLPSMTRGRVWADAESGEVLRLDEQLTGMFEFPVPRKQQRLGGPTWMMIERADTSIHYRPVVFVDPDETLMLPSSIEIMTVWRNAGTQRVRTTHAFSNYRRFVTDSRILR